MAMGIELPGKLVFMNSRKGQLRLFSQKPALAEKNLWHRGSLLLQIMPAAKFTVTTRVELHAGSVGEKAGLFATVLPEAGGAGYADFDWFRFSRD